MASLDIASSQVTKAERWSKLYRTIHHLFLRSEFVHIEDYNKMVSEMNARVTAVEANAQAALNSAVSAIVTMMSAHSHTVVTAGGPSNQAGSTTSVISAAPQLPPTPKAPEVIPVTIAMERTDAMYQAQGPAVAPLADGTHPDQLTSSIAIKSDIGLF